MYRSASMYSTCFRISLSSTVDVKHFSVFVAVVKSVTIKLTIAHFPAIYEISHVDIFHVYNSCIIYMKIAYISYMYVCPYTHIVCIYDITEYNLYKDSCMS